MKISWGTGIAIFFTIFALAQIYQAYRTTQYDHSLVSDQYYADDLRYQEHYDRLVNAQGLDQDLSIRKQQGAESIELHFPEGFTEVNGEIHLFRPSDQASDLRLPIQLGEADRQYLPTQALKKGYWKIKVNWTGDGKAFYKEQDIRL